MTYAPSNVHVHMLDLNQAALSCQWLWAVPHLCKRDPIKLLPELSQDRQLACFSQRGRQPLLQSIQELRTLQAAVPGEEGDQHRKQSSNLGF